MLKSYMKKIFEVIRQGDAREESFYPVLQECMHEYAKSAEKRNIHITSLPKKTEAGNPDFRVWDGRQHIVGYFEAKAPTVENLDQVETTEQLERYRHTFPNLILTNFFEFRLYRNGVLIDKVLVGRPYVAYKLKIVPPVEKEADLLRLLEKFFSFCLPKVYDAKTLAVELAKRTRFLRDEVVAQELKEEARRELAGKSCVLGFYEAFKKFLVGTLSKEEFGDLYSQTITYGLFAARMRSQGDFNRRLAYDNIPHTIGILRDVFRFISLGELPQPMEWLIDDIAEVLAVTDVKSILHQYFHQGRGKDPIVHFYETFLSEYDSDLREKRGVYYTPEPVVSYIVRSLHYVLKDRFNRPDGIGSTSVTVLDPAAGTLTFLTEAAKVAVREVTAKYGDVAAKVVKEHILENFYAFELMMAPYAVGHLKMSFLLEELGYRLHDDDRVKFYLTNTLEMEDLVQTEIPGMAAISEESHLAGKVKKEKPILVILGNPPYSGISANRNQWIDRLLKEDVQGAQSYYRVDGQPLGEKNPKWLQDDYVKFVRFAQWKIEKAGEGALGFITNNSYLDNPTFRGMRQSLMKTFDEIYVLDLHGSVRKRETCPDGGKDENVFDIQQGVAIAIFVKKEKEVRQCHVHYSELFGLRDDKYDWLLKKDLSSTKWKKLSPKSESYFFIPRQEKLSKAYERYPRVTDIFPVHSVGVVTARDAFVIDFSKEALKSRVRSLIDAKAPDEQLRSAFGLADKPNWKLRVARETVRKDETRLDSITEILYRPFDVRWIFYHAAVVERSRKEVMRHMMQQNLGLVFMRQVALDETYTHVLVSEHIIEGRAFYSSEGIISLAPLYLYPQKDNPKQGTAATLLLFEKPAQYGARKPNLSPALVEQLTKTFKKTPTPEQIFCYAYGVLYSTVYRTKYAQFLRTDFPRIPFTRDYRLFCRMAEFGSKLVDLHLLRSSQLDSPIVKFRGNELGYVKKVSYDREKNRVHFSQDQCFEGISREVWECQIGGYQVCEKWLKDRKGRMLSLDEKKTYCRIATALAETLEIQEGIDGIYPQVEK